MQVGGAWQCPAQKSRSSSGVVFPVGSAAGSAPPVQPLVAWLLCHVGSTHTGFLRTLLGFFF